MKMNRTLSGMIGAAKRLESAVTAGIEGAAHRVTGAPAKQPLEIVLAIVEAVERQIQPAGRGRHAFPFNRVRVLVLAPSPLAKAHLEVAVEGPPSLEDRIVERLRSAGCAVGGLAIKVSFVRSGRPEWSHPEFHLEYARQPAAESGQESGPRLELIVSNGTTGRSSYVFDATMVALGRGAEVRDQQHRLIRTNHVAFTEGGGDVNHSVSRKHARIEHDPASGGYRVYDDGSAQGTTVIREGRGVAVPRGTRGMILQSGDELVLGRARLRVKVRDVVRA